MKATPIDELLAIVCRDLSATSARIAASSEPLPAPGPCELRIELAGDRFLLVTFAEPPTEPTVALRRLQMLVDSFRDLLEPARGGASPHRPPPARSLHEELRALAERAGAHDAIVIDARSPVVWGAALASSDAQAATQGGEGSSGEAPGQDADRQPPPPIRLQRGPAGALAGPGVRAVPRIREVPAPKGGAASRAKALPKSAAKASAARKAPNLFIVRGGAAQEEANDSVSERALRAVRALPEMATLHRGGQLHETTIEANLGFVARSFAGIYVLILAFAEPFDELRAKRAVVHALPVIEKLVLALPPQDPAPTMGGVVALRPRFRRRR